jgi:phosphatidylinositol-3,4,5-trisphosphate 3-phosphatase/dual-specificity protein phosphatase PTEN
MEEQQVNPSLPPPASPVDNHDSTPPPAITTADPVPHATSNDSTTQVASINRVAPSSPAAPTSATAQDAAGHESPSSMFSTSGLSSWAKNLKIPQPSSDQESPTGKNTFSRLTSGLGLRSSPKSPQQDESAVGSTTPTSAQAGVFGSLTKGIVDSSRNAVKAVQVKARHMVSQNKRRYQEGGFDLDMTYITENIIAMGFPAGDLSSGIFGYFEGFYRNHMEEVIRFFEMHHKGKYKVYNLCSERLYDASLFEGKVACFPFDDHNCPPIQLVISFCQSAYSWLKEDIENVVVVHCKAGKARTGLMISSLLVYLKFFPTAEESIEYYNQKRCVDGKGLILPSQIRYVKYFERILTYYNGENQPPRRCMLRGFRLHRCPYWIRPSITVSNHNGILHDKLYLKYSYHAIIHRRIACCVLRFSPPLNNKPIMQVFFFLRRSIQEQKN